ncbi:hypothetical protein SAMN02745244_02674 [Tessaracoccus bendigoensis DSM 12906]|uniref:Uncharacterized protein n=1 Tax=Tessaracoccus bendigoensis DSM 12906 TaxID=1123357 RepID=A0A1M6JXF0_9ACTN|nr:hypothetical protein [Tessaracoccus bendigoensis]SHJ51328.1 hypothetical protein SAMN02745244_02674 [Tessaracoccus bendigoensis DSM 12906]
MSDGLMGPRHRLTVLPGLVAVLTAVPMCLRRAGARVPELKAVP